MSAHTLEAQIATPEDVVLNLTIAPWHARLVAFLLDAAIMLTPLVVITMIADTARPTVLDRVLNEPSEGAQLALTIRTFVIFVVTKFYFIFFEVKWSGQTPGKRLMGLRVTMQDGSPLEMGSVVVRNLTRDLETIFPIVAVLSPSSLGLEGGLQIILFVVWLLAISAIPFTNSRHYRLGDLIAKTMVIRLPRAVLLADLTTTPSTAEAEPSEELGATDGELRFTRAQLAHYGAEELHVLEDVLRFHDDDGRLGGALVTNVASRIARKIQWASNDEAILERLVDEAFAQRFLTAFYRAQRAHLEDLLRRSGKADNRASR